MEGDEAAGVGPGDPEQPVQQADAGWETIPLTFASPDDPAPEGAASVGEAGPDGGPQGQVLRRREHGTRSSGLSRGRSPSLLQKVG